MKTAIVELRESHEECIYSQLRFLKDAGHRVTLMLHPVLAKQVSEYGHLAEETLFFDFDRPGFMGKLRLQWHLYGILKKFDRVVFNTAHSYSVIRNLSVALRMAETECIGVLHDTKKLDASTTQNIISKKVRKYFVLNDALLPSGNRAGDIKLQSFYPVFFPKYEPVTVHKQKAIWIGIPGRIDYGRRCYDLLIDVLSEIPNLERVKFLILGKLDRDRPQGRRLYEHIETTGQAERFELFTAFIPNRDFHSYLQACDYIMPLLRPREEYLRHKISGSFNLAFAYKKTLLCNSFFKSVPDLRENSLFFDRDSLSQLMLDIASGTSKKIKTYTDPKWSYAVQQKRYLDFINE